MSGVVIEPGDADYDAARRLWNGMIDLRPRVIARPRSAEGVASAIGVARGHDLPIAVRGGGHNVAGLAGVDDGLVIDLSAMREIDVDPVRRTVRAGGGATWGEVDRATQPFGLATPGGVVSDTGIAGLTLGGGMGWLRRRHGLSADNLTGAEVVLADGSILWTSESERPELLWGLRGGGGNFGVVTTFEFRLHPVGPEIAFAYTFYRLADALAVLRGHERFVAADSAGDVSTLAVLGHIPPLEDFDAALHGASFVAVLAMHAGDAEAGMRALQPLRELAEPLVDMSARMPYLDAQTVFDADYPAGHRYYWKSSRLPSLSDEAIGRLVDVVEEAPSGHSTIDLWLNGGAMSAIPPDATAFGTRDPGYLVSPEANWEHPADDEANVAWTRAVLAAVAADSVGGSYLNFPGFLEEGESLIRTSLGGTFGRLRELKRAYDPDNVFRRNHNVTPAPAI
ncbi:MAG TPA: FAD-binding oxidoreductase [Clostridia bacterium]|nr:FAD-binding oxidoreductase [Clostridia bacterium]